MKNDELILVAAILLTTLVFSFVLFGITGIKVVLAILFISSPMFLILNKFQLEKNEKIIFSILLGFTLFPSLVYLLGLVISFRMSIIIVFFILIGIYFVIRKYK